MILFSSFLIHHQPQRDCRQEYTLSKSKVCLKCFDEGPFPSLLVSMLLLFL
ncbi:hypothetical protein MtrunA17_Chr4g0021671 [Medicago truncatula]|uniref:Uncharacterized protein n=1 Tax=Medicago truncatula TaxID=3880 RepID=A0A396I5P5_MEDTR|nr:hypothetical protein MtrunA17_Chr4g0021671 [Medicago truncatula]